MLYPFMTLDDNTQIVNSETLADGQVRVCRTPGSPRVPLRDLYVAVVYLV